MLYIQLTYGMTQRYIRNTKRFLERVNLAAEVERRRRRRGGRKRARIEVNSASGRRSND